MSRRQLAKLLGREHTYMHRIWSGKQPLRMVDATPFASALNVSVVEIVTRAGLNLDDLKRPIPIVGVVNGQGEATVNWRSRGGPAPYPSALPPDVVAVRMETASSDLALFDGFTLYVAPYKNGTPESEFLGRLCLCKIEGQDAAVVGGLRRGYKAGMWNLSALGRPDVQNVALEWATPVLLIQPPVVE
ncbi:MAG TPA: hypothetical protein VFZ38_17870 [Vicinamibacterales bacterium]